MRKLITVLIALCFTIVSTLPVLAAGPCPSKDVWILVQMQDQNGKDLSLQPLFLPKDEFGKTLGACPETDIELIVPIYDHKGILRGQTDILIDKGYLDNPANVYDKMPANPNKRKKAAPRPRKKREVVPADNIRTWHADMLTPMDNS